MIEFLIFVAVFILAIFFVRYTIQKKAPSLAKIITQEKIPNGTIGFLSGQTVFSNKYVLLTDKKLLYISSASARKIISVSYKDIETIELRGWILLTLYIRTKNGTTIKVAPISRLITTGSSVSVSADTAGEYYLRYMALFQLFAQRLEEKGVSPDIISGIRWGAARARRIFTAIIITLIIVVLAAKYAMWITNSTFVWTF